MERRRLESINDLKNKNEGLSHAILKSKMCQLMREISRNCETKSVETEVYAEGIGKMIFLPKLARLRLRLSVEL